MSDKARKALAAGLFVVAAVCCVAPFVGGLPNIVSQPAVTAVTYVYEKDDNAVPAGVRAGLNRLNRERKIVATEFEEDTKDGDNETPQQYKIPLAEAQKHGLPALVVMAGNDVLAVALKPETEQQVLEAVP